MKCDVIPQYTYDDLVSNGEKLKYDFAVVNKETNFLYLIEVDDEEHRDNHDNCERRLLARQRDFQKDEYCLLHNIDLYRMEVPFRTDKKWAYDDYYRYINTELKFIVDLSRENKTKEDK